VAAAGICASIIDDAYAARTDDQPHASDTDHHSHGELTKPTRLAPRAAVD